MTIIPETNSSHLKHWGLLVQISFLLRRSFRPMFRGCDSVSFREYLLEAVLLIALLWPHR